MSCFNPTNISIHVNKHLNRWILLVFKSLALLFFLLQHQCIVTFRTFLFLDWFCQDDRRRNSKTESSEIPYTTNRNTDRFPTFNRTKAQSAIFRIYWQCELNYEALRSPNELFVKLVPESRAMYENISQMNWNNHEVFRTEEIIILTHK